MHRFATGGSTERRTVERCLYPPTRKKLRATEEMSYAVYIYGVEFSFAEQVAALHPLKCPFYATLHAPDIDLKYPNLSLVN